MAGMSDYKSFNVQEQHSLEDDQPHFPAYLTSPSYPYTSHESRSGLETPQQHLYNRQATSHSGVRPLTSPGYDHHRENLQLNTSRDGTALASRDSSPEDPSIRKYVDNGAAIISIFAENVLSHPFLVLRRQCQVHVDSRRYHLSPFTLVSPVFNICQRQGVGVLFKGLGSSLLVRGMTMLVHDCSCKFSNIPNEITRHSTMKSIFQHLLLKAASFAVITPFYSINIVESTQSEVASESAGLIEVFKEGFTRFISWPSTGRLVPLHVLVLPTVAHGILAYLIYTGIRSVSLTTIRRVRESKERKQGALSKDSTVSFCTEWTANLIGHATAEILLYPLETILHRLHLQGTRTIIDSLDCGIEVTPVITGYEGVLHCFRTIIEEEGFSGLYKGFGALILQYGVQILLIRLVKIVLEKNPFGAAPLPTIDGGIGVSVPDPTVTPASVRRIDTGVGRPTSRQLPSSYTPTGMQGEVDVPRYRTRFTNYNNADT